MDYLIFFLVVIPILRHLVVIKDSHIVGHLLGSYGHFKINVLLFVAISSILINYLFITRYLHSIENHPGEVNGCTKSYLPEKMPKLH